MATASVSRWAAILPLKVSTSPLGRSARVHGDEVGQHGLDFQAGDRADEIHPVRADVGHGPQCAPWSESTRQL